MSNRPPLPAPRHGQKGGFTLIELLVAISIVALLVGLLLTGVQSARSSVQTAQVAHEIRNLETALTQFHAEFGMYPPSSITLYGTSAGWSGDIRSRTIISKLWPQYNFNQPLPAPYGTGSVSLNGAQCLVFFLSGFYDREVDNDGNPLNRGFRGFSKNPLIPFSPEGDNRIGPFLELQLDKLSPNPTSSGQTAGAGYVYLDAFPGQTVPIWYLSSYEGRGYRIGELPDGMVDVYRQAQGPNTTGPNPQTQAWMAKSYQLISPGRDGLYGNGGYYNSSATSNLNPADWDNVTNFSSGTLR